MKKHIIGVLILSTYIWGGWIDTQAIQNFVKRNYSTILNRNADTMGLNYWVQQLQVGNKTASDIAKGFIFSQEFHNKQVNNSTYVNILYKAFLNRNADSGGYTYWMNKLNSGVSRESVLNGFLYSKEFKRLANHYGIRATPRSTLPTSNTTSYLKPIIKSSCNINQKITYFYYETQQEANNNHLRNINSFKSYPYSNIYKPFWDIRYQDPVSKYIDNFNANWTPAHYRYTGLDARNGSKNIVIGTEMSKIDESRAVVQSKCIDNALAGGTTINLYDAPEQSLEHAGPQSTFNYSFGDYSVKPWNYDGSGNYVIQAQFDKPFYGKWHHKNAGGGVNFGLYMHNRKTGKQFSYIITVYAFGTGRTYEEPKIQFDTTTNTAYASTVIKDKTVYAKKSDWSKSTTLARNNHKKMTTFNHTKGSDWKDFYRVNISYQNFKAALNKVQDFNDNDRNPADWSVTSTMIQYEIEEGRNGYGFYEGTITGSFWDFKTYITNSPI